MESDKLLKTYEDWREYLKEYKKRNGKLAAAIAVPTEDFLALLNNFKQVSESNNRRRIELTARTGALETLRSAFPPDDAYGELRESHRRELANVVAMQRDLVGAMRHIVDKYSMDIERMCEMSLKGMPDPRKKVGDAMQWLSDDYAQAHGEADAAVQQESEGAELPSPERPKCKVVREKVDLLAAFRGHPKLPNEENYNIGE